MITSPSITALGKTDITRAWESQGSRNNSDLSASKALLHSADPSDPLRQANRLPIKLLKMLTARAGHILHPEYLQPLQSTPVSPIELDAKKSPLALLAQTCSQIGKPDPSPSTKLSSVTNGSSDKDTKSDTLKLSDIVAEDKSSFKPYAKPPEKKDSTSAGSAGERTGFRVPSATCQPFTPRTCSPQSSASPSPQPAEGDSGEKEEKDSDGNKNCTNDAPGTSGISHSRISVSCAGINMEVNQLQETTSGQKAAATSDSSSAPSASASVLGSGLVAPVSPYKPGQTVFPLTSAGIAYPGALAGPYASYPQHFISHGSSLVNAQLASSLGCSKAGSSPLAGASPPSIMSAGLCRDPYCLSYHCAGHLTGATNSPCAHETAATAAASVLKSGYPLMFPTHPLHTVHSSSQSLTGHPLYPYGFVLPNDTLPHVCNWVSANGPCEKRFSSSEELLNHLRSHTALNGADKLISNYAGSSLASAAAAAMACHMHMPPSGAPGSVAALALRNPHHAIGLGSRYHPYPKSPLPNPGAPIPVPAGTSPYYSPYALYGQRLTATSALGYQ